MIPESLKRPLVVKLLLGRAKDVLDRYPRGFLHAQRVIRRRHIARVKILSRDTDLVIEGFPRSANSFVFQAFAADPGRRLKIASHLHHSSHVVAACQMGVPTVVLIRAPRDAIISAKALGIQSDPRSRAFAAYPIVSFTRRYVHFYERILPYVPSLVLADFRDVTQDVGLVIRAVKSKFSIDIAEFVHTKASERAIFQRSGYHLSPSTVRDQIKMAISQEYDEAVNERWATRAEQLYSLLARRSAAQDCLVSARGPAVCLPAPCSQRR